MSPASLMRNKAEGKRGAPALATSLPPKRTTRYRKTTTVECSASVQPAEADDEDHPVELPLRRYLQASVDGEPPRRRAGGKRPAASTPETEQQRPAEEDVAAAQPPSKRQRVLRAPIPAALPREQLRVTGRESGPLMHDTGEGHFMFTIGDNLTARFKIMRQLGEGTFGRVVECWDRRRGQYVAVKIIRAVEKYRDAAMIELQVLTTLAVNDPCETQPIVRLLEWFDYRGHVCMVFNCLGPTIYDCLRRNHYRAFPLPMARSFAHQVLQAVSYMHSFSLIHTDLKPENILLLAGKDADFEVVPIAGAYTKQMLRLPRETDVRLIDFGSATFNEDYHSTVVSTRHYRAPEIILGLGWAMPCDMWSLGCILVELVTGDALFQTHENLEHLAMMQAVLGEMPERMARRATRFGAAEGVCALFRCEGGALNWPEGAEGKRSLKAVAKLKPLREYLRARGRAEIRPHLDLLVDLVSKLMEWDSTLRMTAEEALLHPFFSASVA